MLPSMQIVPPLQLMTVNVWALDTPPPGAGLKTVIGKLPAVVRSLAGIAAVSSVELTNVVGRAAPLKRTTEAPETNPVPSTVIVSAFANCDLLGGEMLVVVGAGLANVKLTAVPENVLPALSVAVACTVYWPPSLAQFGSVPLPLVHVAEPPLVVAECVAARAN